MERDYVYVVLLFSLEKFFLFTIAQGGKKSLKGVLNFIFRIDGWDQMFQDGCSTWSEVFDVKRKGREVGIIRRKFINLNGLRDMDHKNMFYKGVGPCKKGDKNFNVQKRVPSSESNLQGRSLSGRDGYNKFPPKKRVR